MRYVPRSAARGIYRRYGLSCPACSFKARSLGGLLNHMRYKHPSLLYDIVAQHVRGSKYWRRRHEGAS